jgi:hypothetical protein
MIEDAVGLVGMLCLIGAFLANLNGRLDNDARLYQVLNLVGAGILAWYGVVKETYIFVGLEGFWALAALYALIRTPRAPA